jgi:hypothetical protein
MRKSPKYEMPAIFYSVTMELVRPHTQPKLELGFPLTIKRSMCENFSGRVSTEKWRACERFNELASWRISLLERMLTCRQDGQRVSAGRRRQIRTWEYERAFACVR